MPILRHPQVPRSTGPSTLPGPTAPWERAGTCPLCSSRDAAYLFASQKVPIYRCGQCGLARSWPQPAKTNRRSSLRQTGLDMAAQEIGFGDPVTETEAADAYVEALTRREASRSRMLLIAPVGHPFQEVATRRGFHVETALSAPELESAELTPTHYGSAVVIFELDKTTDPVNTLERVHRALIPDSALLIVTLSLDRWPAKLFGRHWHGWRPEHLYQFDSQTMRSVLARSGFAEIEVAPDRRGYTLEHVYQRAREIPRIGAHARGAARLPHGAACAAQPPCETDVVGHRGDGSASRAKSAARAVHRHPRLQRARLLRRGHGCGDRKGASRADQGDHRRREQLDRWHPRHRPRLPEPPGRKGPARGSAPREGARRAHGPGPGQRRFRPDPGRRPGIRRRRL